MIKSASDVFDFVVVGSGFGGSVAAMRLTEKGYRVLVLERGKRYRDQDFAQTNLHFHKYIWAPALRCFGIFQITPFRDVWVLHGCGVGGGSLGYANVLMQPDEKLFENPAWKHLADWKSILLPHFDTARRMQGVAENPRFWPSDTILKEIAAELGTHHSFQPAQVGVFFGENGASEGELVPDPYFGGEGPPRNACTHCGGCMVGCRENAKNTLVKNYLYFAEKWGAEIRPEAEAHDVRPLEGDQPDGACYEVAYHRSTAWLVRPEMRVRTRNIVFAAGTLGTLRLLLKCRDVTRTLPDLSPRLGDLVRTNSEALMGATSKNWETDYSKGIAITSIIMADDVTAVEPVRYPAKFSLLRFLAGPLVESGGSLPARFFRTASKIFTRPVDFIRTHILPGWAERTTILLVMQTEDNSIRMRLGRDLFNLYRRDLVTMRDSSHPLPARIEIGHRVTRAFARKIGGSPAGTINEGLFNTSMTAHILGGCPFGRNGQEGVVGLDCQIHNYTGLYVTDGSIMPANPGLNPSLTITALAEYAMSQVPPKEGAIPRQPLGISHPASSQANSREPDPVGVSP
jgi:cholesterol oxidase